MTFQQRNSDSPTNLQETNTLFCPAHISGSQQEAEFADHHSLDDYLGNIFQKSSCDSPNIFPPLPMTFKVVLLLPAAPDGRHKLCSRPRWFVLALAHHTHTRNWGWGWVVGAVCIGKRRIYKSHDYVVLPPTVRTFVFICWGLLSEVINFFLKRNPAFMYIIKTIVKII